MIDEERWKETNEYLKKVRLDKFTEKDKSILNAETLDWIVTMSAFTIYNRNYIPNRNEIKKEINREIKMTLDEDFCNRKELTEQEMQTVCKTVYPYVIESASNWYEELKKDFPPLEDEGELEK